MFLWYSYFNKYIKNMTDEYSKILFLNLLKISFTTNATEIRTDMDFFRTRESRIELRKEFVHCIRPMFLKYLLQVDKKTMDKHFNDEDKARILAGFVPKGWSVHHQKPLSWGGRSFNPDMEKKIRAVPLNEEQEIECLNCPYEKDLRFRYQIDNFLCKAQKKGNLERVFIKLFKNYLILLPHAFHSKLEDNFLMPQTEYITKLKSQQPDDTEKVILAPLHHLVWDKFVYQGDNFTLARPTKIKRSKEDCKKRICYKRKLAYLRQHRQRTA